MVQNPQRYICPRGTENMTQRQEIKEKETGTKGAWVPGGMKDSLDRGYRCKPQANGNL